MESRDLEALHRVLTWLAKDEKREMRVDYCEGEVRVYLEQPLRHGQFVDSAWVGQSSDFAGAVDDLEQNEGWHE
ncbi:MAG: hypothetical protein DIU78_013145 [Pseudomonadota bacterium]|jgi:hypothetical protein